MAYELLFRSAGSYNGANVTDDTEATATVIAHASELGIEAAYQLAGQTMALNMMDPAAQEGARAFAEKRTPEWKR